MTHPAPRNNHETHKAPIVKWYCPNLMGSDTSNYPPWCCWHQWTFINTQVWANDQALMLIQANEGLLHELTLTWLSSSHWEQTMSVSSDSSVMQLMISMPVLTLSHPRDTVMPRVTLRDYLASRHTDTRYTSPKLFGVSQLLIGHWGPLIGCE